MNLFLDFKSSKLTLDSFYSEMKRLLFGTEIKNLEKICLAVSGGSDSTALLILTKEFFKKFRSETKIFCVTVNHNLRKEALEEAYFVRKLCNQFGIIHEILTWNHENIDTSNHIGKIENLAREARYNLISDFCDREKIKFLMTGHTWNDQLETFEIRKNKGSSFIGMAGMSQVRSISENLKLLRPLLHFSKIHLQNFLNQKKIEWKNDPMNEMDEFIRVSVRKKIKKYDDQKIKTLSDEILKFGQQRRKIEIEAVDFLKNCDFSSLGYVSFELNKFTSQPIDIQCEIIRRLLWNIGGKKYMIHLASDTLKNILEEKIKTLAGCLIKIKKNSVFIFRENRNLNFINPTNANIYIFDNRFSVSINKKLDSISIECIRRKDFENVKKFLQKNNIKILSVVITTLPCIYQNNKITYMHGIGVLTSDIINNEEKIFSSNFLNKSGLFDIFL